MFKRYKPPRYALGDVLAVGGILTVGAMAIGLLFVGAEFLILDALIGYECYGEGIEYRCVPENSESDVTSD